MLINKICRIESFGLDYLSQRYKDEFSKKIFDIDTEWNQFMSEIGLNYNNLTMISISNASFF